MSLALHWGKKWICDFCCAFQTQISYLTLLMTREILSVEGETVKRLGMGQMALCKQIWRWKSDFVGSFCNANNANILTSSLYSAVPLTTRGDLELRTTTARSQTPTPRTSATKPRSRLTPLETSATAAPTTTKRSSSTTTKVEQIHPSSTIPTVSTEQPQSNATSRITPATPSTSATASSSAIPSAKLPPEHFPNFLSLNDGNYNVSWMYNSETDRLHFMIDVMATGWVGFGVARSAPTGMQGYDVAVGGVLNGLAYLQVKRNS